MPLQERCHYRPNKRPIGLKNDQIGPQDKPHKAKNTRQIRLENAPNKLNMSNQRRTQKTCTAGPEKYATSARQLT